MNKQTEAEAYVAVPHYPAYRASSAGRIQSRWRCPLFKNGVNVGNEWRDLRPGTDAKGYLGVGLCDGSSPPKAHRVHKIIALCFLGPVPPDKPIVRHLDGQPSNNSALNLAYGSYVDNENDKLAHGTWHTRNGGAKVTPEQVTEIRGRAKKGEKQIALALEYRVSRSTITRIVNGSIWKA